MAKFPPEVKGVTASKPEEPWGIPFSVAMPDAKIVWPVCLRPGENDIFWGHRIRLDICTTGWYLNQKYRHVAQGESTTLTR